MVTEGQDDPYERSVCEVSRAGVGDDVRHGTDMAVQAVLFDMDGVVTDTAEAHAAAWQRLFDEFLKSWSARYRVTLHPFDPDHDYKSYLDGKPRYDGVESFLAARGISLPWGLETDGPEAETICGLGNRKNEIFRAWLDENAAKVFPGTMAFMEVLGNAGVRKAVFSASRNAAAVLRSAGVLQSFAVRLDGDEAASLGLPGKPDPAMLIEAAARLGIPPAKAAVIEDSIAGVTAGRAGGFGLVIGVDRGGNAAQLAGAGADIVINDVAELTCSRAGEIGIKRLSTRPLATSHLDEIRDRLVGHVPVVFLDYDGTLTPIVEDYRRAFLPADMRQALQILSRRCRVAVVSGRDVAILRGLVQLNSLYYAGSHGFEIEGPGGWKQRLEKGVEFLPELDKIEAQLRARLTDIDGHAVERKRFSVAVHYRRAGVQDVPRIERIVEEALTEFPRLHMGHGKKVFRVQPDIRWDKGRAVEWLVERLDSDQSAILPLYIGDDITDEDAFRVLAGTGMSIAVRGEEDRQTAADYALPDTDEVARFLKFLAETGAGEA